MKRRDVIKNLSALPLAGAVLPLDSALDSQPRRGESAQPREIDILLKGGHVIDPKNNIDGIMDVAVKDGKIARVERNINSTDVAQIVNATGMYVTPGLIDTHTHVFVGSEQCFADGWLSIPPDYISLKAGITTMVDVGCSGWRNFALFKRNVIDRSSTRVLAFLNIAGDGMKGNELLAVGGVPTEEDMNDMSAQMTANAIRQHSGIIVGVKVGHFRNPIWTPFDRALEACEIANVPLFLECNLPQWPLDEILKRLRKGDIYAHTFFSGAKGVLDENGILKDSVIQARNKGVLFDLGHGNGMFHFDIAIKALAQGFKPDTFGSDLHRPSVMGSMRSMIETMSKFLNMGMSISEIINIATWSSAQAIGRPDLGNLSVGSEADIAVINERKGNFGFLDTRNQRLQADRRLDAEMTIRAGRIVWDLNGMAGSNL